MIAVSDGRCGRALKDSDCFPRRSRDSSVQTTYDEHSQRPCDPLSQLPRPSVSLSAPLIYTLLTTPGVLHPCVTRSRRLCSWLQAVRSYRLRCSPRSPLRRQRTRPGLRPLQPPNLRPPRQRTAKAQPELVDRIKEEGLKRSQVMATLSYLTDVIGPRLTGSPNLKRANEWTCQTLASGGWRTPTSRRGGRSAEAGRSSGSRRRSSSPSASR